MSKASQMILACTAAPLNQMAVGPGAFLRMDSLEIRAILQDTCGLWIGPRGLLEEQPLFRQIIPYAVVMVGDKYLRYRRTPVGGEQRLHGKYSIGFGGHVELHDLVFQQGKIQLLRSLADAMARELREELAIDPWLSKSRTGGLLIDNSSEVGRVHVGSVEIWQFGSMPTLTGTDGEVGELEAMDLSSLYAAANRETLEPWSKLIVEALHGPDWP